MREGEWMLPMMAYSIQYPRPTLAKKKKKKKKKRFVHSHLLPAVSDYQIRFECTVLKYLDAAVLECVCIHCSEWISCGVWR